MLLFSKYRSTLKTTTITWMVTIYIVVDRCDLWRRCNTNIYTYTVRSRVLYDHNLEANMGGKTRQHENTTSVRDTWKNKINNRRNKMYLTAPVDWKEEEDTSSSTSPQSRRVHFYTRARFFLSGLNLEPHKHYNGTGRFFYGACRPTRHRISYYSRPPRAARWGEGGGLGGERKEILFIQFIKSPLIIVAASSRECVR